MPVSTVSASVAAETVYPVMVNGYLCYSAAEVAAVRRGQSPDSVRPGAVRQDEDDAVQQAAQAQAQTRALTEAQTRIAQFSQLSADEQRLLGQDGRRGQLIDLYA